MSDVLKEVLTQVVQWCDLGFERYDPIFYPRIVAALQPFKQDRSIKAMRNMAKAGPSMQSLRFAYPHIRSYALEMLKGLDNDPSHASGRDRVFGGVRSDPSG